jgi:Conserved protein/domain typically associated with flavoprotein oxygenases, DIM6/NTAB family
MPIDESDFKKAMSHFASGITVITTTDGNERSGMTAASFASLSLRPPLVVICVEKTVRTHDAIVASKKFAVNILTKEQCEISTIFATKSGDRFEGVATHDGKLGLPLIDGALASIECTLHAQLPGGDHSIFVGEVMEVEMREGAPLIYYRSGYYELAATSLGRL